MDRKIIKNTALLSTANLLARLIGFFYFIFLGRALGVENFGHYNFALALVYNFYPVADFGVERLILRDLSKEKQKAQDYFQKIIPLRFVFALFSIILVNFLGFFLAKSSKDLLHILIFSLCLIPWTFNQLVAGIGNAFEKMEFQSIVAISSTGLTAIFGGLIASRGGSVGQILSGALLANMVVSLMMLNYAKKINLSFKIELDFSFWKKIISQSWVFASIMIMAVFYLRSSVVLVNYFKGAYFTGLYSSVFKFVEASILIPQSFALALFPQTARLLKEDKKSLFPNYLKSLGFLFLLSLPFAFVFLVLSPLLVKTVYGDSYLPAVEVMKVLSLAVILFFLNTLPGNIIHNSEKIKKFLFFAFFNLAFMIGIGFFLIPRYAIVGAAWAVVLAEFFGFLINNSFVIKILQEKN